MPYALSFTKQLPVSESDQYINDCCIGGDIVLDQLLPALRSKYYELQPDQEDWGWCVWFQHNGLKLAVDVFTNDHLAGEFQMHLTTSKPRFLLSAKAFDTPELEALKNLVVDALQTWPVSDLLVERVDSSYRPIPSTN